MRRNLATDLAQALEDLLARPMGPDEMRAYELWRNPELRHTGSSSLVSLPISRVMTDRQVIVHDWTLIVFFKWPLEPDRQFAYIEELGDEHRWIPRYGVPFYWIISTRSYLLTSQNLP